jgi:serine/threonine-protein kinase
MVGGLIEIDIGDVHEVELLELLGAGGFGSAWKVRNLRSGMLFMLKIIQGIKPDSALAKRVRLEADIVLPSPYIVPARGLCEWDPYTYLILFDYVRGRSLDDLIASGSLTDEQKRRIFLQILEGVSDAHHQNVIHRDLKPANILIEVGTGDVRIIDFGISKFKGKGVTQSGDVLGSPAYMAPELLFFDARSADARTDIYALGHILYVLSTGLHFWERQGWYQLSDLVGYLARTPAPTDSIDLSDFRCSFMPEVERVIGSMVCIDPDGRYRSVDEVLAALGVRYELPAPPAGLRLDSPMLIVESGSNRRSRVLLSLRDGEVRIVGRADIAGDDTSVSRSHLEVSRAGNSYRIRDISSTGTWMRGSLLVRYGPPVDVRHGDRIRMGDVFLRFAFLRAEDSALP